jgi:tryptophanyl-tRNA synthetase
MKAKTDSGPTSENQEKPREIQNLFELMAIVSTADTISHFESAYNNCTIRYGDMKKQLAADMNMYIAPFREKINDLLKNDDYLKKVAAEGAEQAKVSAEKTLSEVRRIMGIRYF